MSNPIQYTSRTFTSILNDINTDANLVDKPNWWKRLWAGIGDVLSMWLNAAINNMFLRTAYTRQAVDDLLRLIDYQMTEQTTSVGTVLFHISTSAAFPFTVSKANLVGLTVGSSVVGAKRFEARSQEIVTSIWEVVVSGDVSAANDTFIVTRVYVTGEKVRLTTSNTLPAPLSINTDYFAIYVDDTTIKLALSIVNAYLGTEIDLTDAGVGSHTVWLYSFQKTVYQQQSVESLSIGVSDGTTEFQEFGLPDLNILKATLAVTINGLSWTVVDTLIDAGPTDRNFRVIYNTDNSSKLQFGNGTFGLVPPAFDIYVEYATGGGIDSNISTLNKINVYAGSDSNVTGVSNSSTLTGGDNPESIASAKILGPLLLKASNRFVTVTDGEALALAYGGISQVKINANTYGLLSAQVLCIADGGGNTTGPYKALLDTYLTDRSPLGSMDVRVEDLTITDIAVTSSFKVLTGFVYATVLPFYELAIKLALSETGAEIIDEYEANGIELAITLINTIFSTAFTVLDQADIVPLIENLEPTAIGVDVQYSTFSGYLDSNVRGVDYLLIALPVAFPISVATDEITSNGVITTTEIV